MSTSGLFAEHVSFCLSYQIAVRMNNNDSVTVGVEAAIGNIYV